VLNILSLLFHCNTIATPLHLHISYYPLFVFVPFPQAEEEERTTGGSVFQNSRITSLVISIRRLRFLATHQLGQSRENRAIILPVS
jgi:hypothetical protein